MGGLRSREFGISLLTIGSAIALAGVGAIQYAPSFVLPLVLLGILLSAVGVCIVAFPNGFARSRLPNPSNDKTETNAVPATKRHDANKIALIDRIYPLMYDLSETHVDNMGNVSGDWRRAFIDGEGRIYFDRVDAEYRVVGERFSVIRSLVSRHGQYLDLVNLVEPIAEIMNAPGKALAIVRQKAEMLGFEFTPQSLDLVADDVHEFHKAIGSLRLHLSRECLPALVKMRNEAA